MYELLWFVAYCGEFPARLAQRVPGHPEWNRHVMYRAIKKGYVAEYRGKYQQRVVRSLRITNAGIDYITARHPEETPMLLARVCDMENCHSRLEKVLRVNAVATGTLMAANAGAHYHPSEKPDLTMLRPTVPVSPDETYYYSVYELRNAILQYHNKSAAKTSRIIGVLVRGRRCYCMYYSGHSRMVWRSAEELNAAASVTSLLETRGFPELTMCQIVIGNNMHIPEKIARYGIDSRRRFMTVSSRFESCHYLSNDRAGDDLLRVMMNDDLARDFEKRVMLPSFLPPQVRTRSYDAVTPDGRRPVTLNYRFDISALLRMDHSPEGFTESPILLCLDYQVDAIQKILGGTVEVRAITERLPV